MGTKIINNKTVQDVKGRSLYAKDFVRCVSAVPDCLTLNAEYRVEDVVLEGSRVVINPDDKGNEGLYFSCRFELIVVGEDLT